MDDSIPWVGLNHRTPSSYEANRYRSIFASEVGRSVLFGLPGVGSRPRLPLLPTTRETGRALLEGPPYAGAKPRAGRPDPVDALGGPTVIAIVEGRDLAEMDAPIDAIVQLPIVLDTGDHVV